MWVVIAHHAVMTFAGFVAYPLAAHMDEYVVLTVLHDNQQQVA